MTIRLPDGFSAKLPTTWKTLDGRTLKIKEMETDHLVNTLKHIEKVIKMRNTQAELGGSDYREDWADVPTYKAISNELKTRRIISELGN